MRCSVPFTSRSVARVQPRVAGVALCPLTNLRRFRGVTAYGIDPQIETSAYSARSAAEIKRALRQAIDLEDYAEAARLRDELKRFEEEDKLESLMQRLNAAVAAEHYEDAAELRDQIRHLITTTTDVTIVPPQSDVVTEGVRVCVRSEYAPIRSMEARELFLFSYTITITNESNRIVMLRRRHWMITDSTGRVEHVRGPGVVGKMPVLNPGQCFQYTSSCPLRSSSGTMEGEYEFVELSESGEWGRCFDVTIGRFGLDANSWV